MGLMDRKWYMGYLLQSKGSIQHIE